MPAGFPQREKAAKMGTTVFHNLILEVMCHHQSCPIPLVTQTIPGTKWEGTTERCESQEPPYQVILDTGSHLEHSCTDE